MNRFALGLGLGLTFAAGAAFGVTYIPYISGTLTSGHALIATADGLGVLDGGVPVSLGGTNTWTAAQTFGTVIGTVETITFTSGSDYVAVAADCGKTKLLITGTTPTVHLPNINQNCTIAFVTTVAISYQFLPASGGSTQNSQNFTKTRGTNPGDSVVVTVVTPSATAAKWSISGDFTS